MDLATATTTGVTTSAGTSEAAIFKAFTLSTDTVVKDKISLADTLSGFTFKAVDSSAKAVDSSATEGNLTDRTIAVDSNVQEADTVTELKALFADAAEANKYAALKEGEEVILVTKSKATTGDATAGVNFWYVKGVGSETSSMADNDLYVLLGTVAGDAADITLSSRLLHLPSG